MIVVEIDNLVVIEVVEDEVVVAANQVLDLRIFVLFLYHSN